MNTGGVLYKFPHSGKGGTPLSTIQEFKRKKDYLVCVDSDGCAMDTMDCKHIRCFGPCLVEEWALDKWKDAILARWNDINLYTMTRGINRFKGLNMMLTEVDKQYTPIDHLADLTAWVNSGAAPSNDALQKAIDETDSPILKKALSWSKAVNKAITALPDSVKLPYPGVKEALAFAHEKADIAIVSSANPDAVLEEWDKYGLLPHTDVVCAQDVGSKAYCIAELLKQGYASDHVLMCGDAPGDMDAATQNGVFYYPIRVRHEKACWEEFVAEGFGHLLDGTYGGEYQQGQIDAFLKNLGG